MYRLTIFKSIFDNKTHRRMSFDSLEEFEAVLFDLSKQKFDSKKEAYLISPAVYVPESTRANKNVTEWGGWAAVDVDDHKFDSENLEDELKSKYGDHYFICYSTASSRVDYPKFRLVFPLTESVKSSSIKHFWYSLNNELGSIGDKQTKDLSRMYYIPGDYKDAHNFMFINREGDFIDPNELMDKHPYVPANSGNSFVDSLPEELQKAVIEHRKNSLKNKEKYNWSSLRDCPFVNKKIITEYKSISETGWYSKMYQFMVSVAFNSIKKGYPIDEVQLEKLARELDNQTGNWYENRPLRVEATSAINYAYKNSKI